MRKTKNSVIPACKTNIWLDYDHPQAFTDADGNKVVVEYKENEAGQRVKITRRIKTTLKREKVNKAVAEHKRWAKFGDERGHLPGPDVATTTVGEKVFLKLSLGGSVPSAVQQTEEDDSAKWKEQLKGKKILCRICKGDHFTTKCPYKGTLKPLDEIEASSSSAAGPGSSDKKGIFSLCVPLTKKNNRCVCRASFWSLCCSCA